MRVNTEPASQGRDAAPKEGATWLFAYGSLIFKVDFPYLERRQASVAGWQRRFWQGSHDHRGTPEAPGRVVTLVPGSSQRCEGVAYRIESEVFEYLDHREKNGYLRVEEEIDLQGTGATRGVVYIADEDNPAYLGPAPDAEIARHIARSRGPSGPNSDYLLELAEALRAIQVKDPHVFALEALLCQVPSPV